MDASSLSLVLELCEIDWNSLETLEFSVTTPIIT